ncbi:hypothetical protein C8F04DRAFT_1393724 [Mycena alexandri]|uniref:Uncharacterized protein n=1 Tax=Mycena alexandri TaxID=1745969 RepID=A0AAD6T0S0_9AGAR|nr:hypothetical protein C8F04DRAFT_1393724 [Mycena alexandri]
MPPKARPVPRKPSLSKAPAASASAVKLEQDAKAMPPPPAPVPAGILVPEVTALATCLKNAVVKTGQLYAFYADTRKLGIQNHAPAPPQSLTSALGREVEKYDQLCDSIESQLASLCFHLRAISVLQRDLAREERRIKEAEAEAEAKAKSIAGRTRSASRSPTSTRIPLPAIDLSTAAGDGSRPSTADANMSPSLPNSSIAGRRPSAISISSLHRPNFLKLDLSTIQITPEEASLFSQGLASPVTLAPRSARPYGPNELPPEIMAALASASSDPQSQSQTQPGRPVDIDLTSPDHAPPPDVEMTALGNTADKPIELDLDAMEIDMAMSGLFGDGDGDGGGGGDGASSTGGEGLFTPVIQGPNIRGITGTAVKQEEEDDSFLSALSGAGGGDDIFASLRASATGDGGAQSDVGGASGADGNNNNNTNNLLASFSQMGGDPSQMQLPMTGQTGQYDLSSIDLGDLSPGFFGDTQNIDANDMGFDMEELLSMGPGGDAGEQGQAQPDGGGDIKMEP